MPRTIATTDRVDRDGLLEFVRPRHHMILVTRRRDGAPQLSPVTAGVDEQGRIVVASYPERAKVTNLRRDADCAVLVLSDEFDGPWVQVDGTAEVLDLPDALDPLGRLLPQHQRRALGLGRVQAGDARPGQVFAAHHAHPVGARRHRRFPGPPRRGVSARPALVSRATSPPARHPVPPVRHQPG